MGCEHPLLFCHWVRQQAARQRFHHHPNRHFSSAQGHRLGNNEDQQLGLYDLEPLLENVVLG